jgi:hypothetical protein
MEPTLLATLAVALVAALGFSLLLALRTLPAVSRTGLWALWVTSEVSVVVAAVAFLQSPPVETPVAAIAAFVGVGLGFFVVPVRPGATGGLEATA